MVALLIFLVGGTLLFSAAILCIIYLFLTTTTNRNIRLAISVVFLLIGFFVVERADIETAGYMSLFVIAPVASLIPVVVIAGLLDLKTGFNRILAWISFLPCSVEQ